MNDTYLGRFVSYRKDAVSVMEITYSLYHDVSFEKYFQHPISVSSSWKLKPLSINQTSNRLYTAFNCVPDIGDGPNGIRADFSQDKLIFPVNNKRKN